ncbi:MAG: C25 family cysteine peptidase [Chloroflexota bacterium]|nr:C25 family cysteine peptidase [Chloroflexota bacterium]
MKINRAWGVLMTAFLILGSSFTSPATAQAPHGSHLQLLHSDEQGVVLELTIDDFQIETVAYGRQTYHRLIIPDMVQTTAPGEPQVPTRGALLGIPFNEGVSVQIVDADYETLRGYRLCPAPDLEGIGDSLDDLSTESVRSTFVLSQDLYVTDAFYPGTPVEIGYTGAVRDQAVTQVQFYPVQYNPATNELRLYRRILARVTWDTPLAETTVETRETNPAYENLLRNTLLNYDGLERSAVAKRVPWPGSAGTQVAAASSPTATLKIGVTEDGLYELAYDALSDAGLDLSTVDPHTIKISNQGSEIPIYVHGEDSGVFTTSDYILFYGTAITDVYTVENLYWLTAGGNNGQRMSTRDGTLSGTAQVPPNSHFPTTLHAEEDNYYWQTMPNGAGQDHWFWGNELTAPVSQTYSLVLNNISTAATTATVRVRLKGRTDDLNTDPDHHIRIYLNDVKIDDQLWNGMIIYDHEVVTVPHSLLNEGSNTITVESVGDTGAVVDQLFFNWMEISYWDTYVAEDDELLLGTPTTGTFQFEVTGFTTNTVHVFDVTDPANVATIINTTILTDGGNYKLQFEDTAQPVTRYLALTPARHKSPTSIEVDQPSSWKSTSNGADYIIITHEDFYTSSLTLASHRNIASGLRVATVKVEDIYDEFNYGIFNPQAIRDFLSYVYHNWAAPAPTYILLVGDATQDYKDNYETGTVNYVPSQVIETDLLGETPSDNWFVLVSGDDILPDMFIGRLSVQTVSQVDDVVNKIIHYEQNPPDDSWNKNVLLVADDDDSAFEIISDQIADRVPFYYTATKVYAGNYPPGDPTTDIANTINGGSILVNYTGHGSVDMWGLWGGSQHIFDRSDITSLTNTHKLPMVMAANCLNGFFTGPKTQVSLAEEFLRLQDRGAVAAWAPTGLGYPSGHRALMREFYETIFQDDQYGLGAATVAAGIATYGQNSSWGELVETFVLFGDPVTQLGIPTNYPYVESTIPAHVASGVPIDQEIQIVFNKPMVTTTVTLGGEGTLGLPFTPTWSAENTVLNYTHLNFGHGETLTFTISGQDRLGNPVGDGLAPSTWALTVTDDEVPPSGIIGVEVGGLTSIPVDASLYITFTEPVRTDSVAYTIVPSVPGWLFWSPSGEVARFDHVDFQEEEAYTFTVATAKDVAGNELAEPLEQVFTTRGTHLVYLPVVLRND